MIYREYYPSFTYYNDILRRAEFIRVLYSPQFGICKGLVLVSPQFSYTLSHDGYQWWKLMCDQTLWYI